MMEGNWSNPDNQFTLLVLLAEGCNQQEMAQEMGCAQSHIQTGIRHLRWKLQARNNPHLVALAYHEGILVPGRRQRARTPREDAAQESVRLQ